MVLEGNVQGGSFQKAHIPHPEALPKWDCEGKGQGHEDPYFLVAKGQGENVLTALLSVLLTGPCLW